MDLCCPFVNGHGYPAGAVTGVLACPLPPGHLAVQRPAHVLIRIGCVWKVESSSRMRHLRPESEALTHVPDARADGENQDATAGRIRDFLCENYLGQ